MGCDIHIFTAYQGRFITEPYQEYNSEELVIRPKNLYWGALSDGDYSSSISSRSYVFFGALLPHHRWHHEKYPHYAGYSIDYEEVPEELEEIFSDDIHTPGHVTVKMLWDFLAKLKEDEELLKTFVDGDDETYHQAYFEYGAADRIKELAESAARFWPYLTEEELLEVEFYFGFDN